MGATLAGLFSGVLFGVGLVISGMTSPNKVIGFLDVAGSWDPSLAMVMAGAIGVFAPAYRYLIKNTVPLFGREFLVRVGNEIDGRLVAGASLFGMGWGMAGLCPGPALVAAGTMTQHGLLFVAAMLTGMWGFDAYQRASTRKLAATAASGG